MVDLMMAAHAWAAIFLVWRVWLPTRAGIEGHHDGHHSQIHNLPVRGMFTTLSTLWNGRFVARECHLSH